MGTRAPQQYITSPQPPPDFAGSVRGFDVIFGDHTNEQFSGFVGDALVVENLSKGASYTKVNVTYDRTSRRVTERANIFVEPRADRASPPTPPSSRSSPPTAPSSPSNSTAEWTQRPMSFPMAATSSAWGKSRWET